MTDNNSMIDYNKIRQSIAAGSGPEYWRSLDELANSPDFQARLKQEFPSQESRWVDPVTRRSFLKVMGASLALTGLAGCTGFSKPREHILPYTNQPENMVPGKALFFASAMPYLGYGYPVLVESHEGRPTKIEGNPEHPDSLGAALSHVQASVLDMYDPDRAQMATYLQEPRDWTDFSTELTNKLAEVGGQGEGFVLLTETITSPSIGDQVQALLKKYPGLRWVQYDPAARDNVREGARLAFGEYVDHVYKLENADVIVSLDADFMVEGPTAVRNAKAFASRRRLLSAEKGINRFYAVESHPTNSGSLADHRVLLKPSLIEAFARQLAAGLGVAGAGAQDNPAIAKQNKALQAMVADLKAANGRAVVIAGEDASPAVHALAHAMNAALGAAGNTVNYIEPVEVKPTNQLEDLKALVADMNAGKVKAIVVMGANPVYNAPADLKFADALKRVPWRAVHSMYFDETALLCQWHIPAPHYLEAWGDVRSGDGTVSIVQPLIAPLYATRTQHELLQLLSGEAGKTSFNVVQDYWKKQRGEADFDKFWRRSVHDGFIAETSAKAKQVTAKTDAAAFPASPAPAGEIELALRKDPTVHDGRFANNAWLQELPKPFSKVTWDNAVYMSMSTAQKLKVANEDVVKVSANGATVEGPVFVVMGHAADCITVHLGYGRTHGGRVAMEEDDHNEFFKAHGNQVGIPRTVGTRPRGMDAYKLWKSDVPRVGAPVKVEATGGKYQLSCTQLHFSLDDNGVNPGKDIPVIGELFEPITNGAGTQLGKRGLVRRGTLADLRQFEELEKNKAASKEHGHEGHDDHMVMKDTTITLPQRLTPLHSGRPARSRPRR